jgi:hypothetical protein
LKSYGYLSFLSFICRWRKENDGYESLEPDKERKDRKLIKIQSFSSPFYLQGFIMRII